MSSWAMALDEDRLGMKLEADTADIEKDAKGFVGITIGGGFPYCPCVYVVQVFERSPADVDGRIRAGDEVVSINGISVKGGKKTEVAQLIQKSESPVRISFNRLIVDISKGKTLDILFKKAKHKLVENVEAETADALGLSRAVLCNDPLLVKLRALESQAAFYSQLVTNFRSLAMKLQHLSQAQKEIGDVLCETGARQEEETARESFSSLGEALRSADKHQNATIAQIRPMVGDFVTFVEKAIPDTQLTVKKYVDVKSEYLSYCLKQKEMDDEESEFHALHEPLIRLETGNYEYRLMLRCKEHARAQFVRCRQDVATKIDLLEHKHIREIAIHLSRFTRAVATANSACSELFSTLDHLPNELEIEAMLKAHARRGTTKANAAQSENDDDAADEQEAELLLGDEDEDQKTRSATDRKENNEADGGQMQDVALIDISS